MVGVAGFEPATTRTPSVCATRLRYTPTARKSGAKTEIIIALAAKLQLNTPRVEPFAAHSFTKKERAAPRTSTKRVCFGYRALRLSS
jgi:hypothetical protein